MQSILANTEENQTLHIIQGEIKLAEREKEKVLQSLKQLQEVRAIENKEYESNYKQKRKEVTILTEQKATLEKEVKELNGKKEKMQKDAESYSLNEVTKAKEAVEVIYTKAKQTDTEADKKMSDVNEREGLVYIREQDVNKREEKLTIERAELETKARTVKESENALLLKVEEVSAQVKTLDEKRDKLEKDILTKTAQIKGLDITIDLKLKYVEDLTKEAEDRMRIVKRMQAENKLGKYMQDQKEEKLRIKEIQLKDRQRTLQRGFDELRSKGGTVNG